jgi:hypothetical protein
MTVNHVQEGSSARGVTLEDITKNWKSNCKPYIMSCDVGPLPWNNHPWASIPCHVDACKSMWLQGTQVNHTAAPISGNKGCGQTNSYVTTRVCMPSGPLLEHYMDVHDYRLGSAHKLVYRGNEKSPLKLHFWVLQRNTQVGICASIVEQHHRDRKDSCWWDRSFMNVLSLNIWKICETERGRTDVTNTNRCGKSK